MATERMASEEYVNGKFLARNANYNVTASLTTYADAADYDTMETGTSVSKGAVVKHGDDYYLVGAAFEKTDGGWASDAVTGAILKLGATGGYSATSGSYTVASGRNSCAVGDSAAASGRNSHAEGNGTTASGGNSHAEGSGATASGSGAHAEGIGTIASGGGSHAEGNGTTASGSNAHAEGYGAIASGGNSHAEGRSATASGSYAHAEGYNSTASGNYSHAEGYGTTAGGTYAHAEGFGTATQNDVEHAEGKYNASHTGSASSEKTLRSVGFGAADASRKNAVETMLDGKTFVYGVGGYDGTNPTGSGVKDIATVIGAKADSATTYTKTEVDAIVAAVKTGSRQIVTSLDDVTDPQPLVIYMVAKSSAQTSNVYDEYIWLASGNSGSWEKIGDTEIDLTNYVQTTDSRLSDARTPTAHKSSHATGGSDAIAPSDIGAAASSHTHSASDITSGLATVATSGSYSDLTNKPTIPIVPTNVSAFTNDAGYLTASSNALRYAMPVSVALVAENDAATLVCGDRAVTNATIASGFATLNLTFPAEVSGYVRDFYLRITVAAGETAPAISVPQGVTIENAGGSVPEIADGEASAAATTLVWFSETAPGVFTAKSETVSAVA